MYVFCSTPAELWVHSLLLSFPTIVQQCHSTGKQNKFCFCFCWANSSVLWLASTQMNAFLSMGCNAFCCLLFGLCCCCSGLPRNSGGVFVIILEGNGNGMIDGTLCARVRCVCVFLASLIMTCNFLAVITNNSVEVARMFKQLI